MKFSLIVTTFNLENYICKCLISLKPLLNNNLFEILVIDDGSTDNTVNLIENFINKNPSNNIQFIKKQWRALLGKKPRSRVDHWGFCHIFRWR